MFTVLDSSDVRQVAVSDHPFRSLRLPTALQGNIGEPVAAFSPSVELGVRLLLRMRWLSS
jgi:hypothetical protein